MISSESKASAATPLAASGHRRTAWVIEPRMPGPVARFQEFWQYRRLIKFFGLRTLQKIYARTVLGWAWVIIRPLFPIVTSSLVFGNLLGIGSENVPYPLFFMVGMTAWHVFASSLTWITRSLELNSRFLKRLYFPRLILPISASAPTLVDLAVHVAIIAGLVVYFRLTEGTMYLSSVPQIAAGVGALLAIFGFSLSIGLWTAVWGAAARDVRFTLGYLLDFWFFLTPVIYPLSVVPEGWRWLTVFNPMAVLIETFKWGVLGVGHVSLESLAIAVSVVVLNLALGLRYFFKYEAESVDRL